MAYRDGRGHFISEDEARERGMIPAEAGQAEAHIEEEDPDMGDVGGSDEQMAPPSFGEGQRQAESVPVDTGRGDVTYVPAGSPFVPTLERLADEAHYGGYFRIFLNGREVINPEDSPATIEPGMRLVITSYDKVGLQTPMVG